MVAFADVKTVLDTALTNWQTANGRAPDLSGHDTDATNPMNWSTKDKLLAAEGHNFRLIQPEVIGNGKGDTANLVVDLKRGIKEPAFRMPKGGPFISDADIQIIIDWINAGCP